MAFDTLLVLASETAIELAAHDGVAVAPRHHHAAVNRLIEACRQVHDHLLLGAPKPSAAPAPAPAPSASATPAPAEPPAKAGKPAPVASAPAAAAKEGAGT